MAVDKRFECPDCGKMVLKLWDHGCPGTVKQPPAHPNKALPRPVQLMGALTDRPKEVRKEPLSTERVRRWRSAKRATDPVGFRKRMSDYMKKWRARPDDGAR